MDSVTIFLIRHGQTDYNKRGIIQGGGINSSLNLTGQYQAQAFFDHYREESFSHLYASDLQRTAQTLEPWKALGHEVVEDPAIREFSWGFLEGKIPGPEDKEVFVRVRQRWAEGYLHEKISGGESPLDAWERSRGFFESLPDRHPGQQILVCSHGRQMRVILSALLDKDLSKMERYEQPNTGLFVLEMNREGAVRLDREACTRHLDPFPHLL